MKKKNPAAVALGKLGGKVKSAAKAAAARENGKKPKRKRRTIARALLLAVFVLVSACGSPIEPTPTAALEARGELTLACDDSTCRFSGQAVNRGTGCASQITGTVALRIVGQDAPRSEVPISVAAIVAPGEFQYSGEVSKKIVISLMPTQWYTSTSFAWTDGPCR